MTDALGILLSLTLSGSLMALVLYLLSLAAGRRLPRFALYYAWLIVALRFVVPLASPLFESGAQLPAPAPLVVQNDVVETQPVVVEPVLPQWSVYGAISPMQEALPLEEAGFSLSPASVALGIWAAGVVGIVSYAAISYLRFLRRILPQCRPADGRDQLLVLEMEPRARIRLLVHPGGASPLLAGFFRSVIIVPAQGYCRSGKEKQLRCILAHELTHYRRHDLWIKALMSLITALHWFNPVIYLVQRQLHSQCEFSCDEAVLHRLDPRSRLAYGDALIDTAMQSLSPVPVSTLFFGLRPTLANRILRIRDFRPMGRRVRALSLALVLVILGSSVCIGPLRAHADGSLLLWKTQDTAGKPFIASFGQDLSGIPLPYPAAAMNSSLQGASNLNFHDPALSLSEERKARLDPQKSYTLPYWIENSGIDYHSHIEESGNLVDFPILYASLYAKQSDMDSNSRWQQHEQEGCRIASALFEIQESQYSPQNGHMHSRYLHREPTQDGSFVRSLDVTCKGYIYRAQWDTSHMQAHEDWKRAALAPYEKDPRDPSPKEVDALVRRWAAQLGYESLLPADGSYSYSSSGSHDGTSWQELRYYHTVDGLHLPQEDDSMQVEYGKYCFLRVILYCGHITEVYFEPQEFLRIQLDDSHAPLNLMEALDHLNDYNQTTPLYSWQAPPLPKAAYNELVSAYPVLAAYRKYPIDTGKDGISNYRYYYVPAWCFEFSTAHDPQRHVYAYVHALTGETFLKPGD